MKPYMGLKAGDKVFIHCNGGKPLALVEKVTPKGFVKVNGTLYDSHGIQRGGGTYYKFSIKPATDESIQEYERECFVRTVIRKIHEVPKITYEQAVAIDAILGGGKEGQT